MCIVWRTVDKCNKRHFPLREPHAHYYFRNFGRNGCQWQAVAVCCVRTTVQRPFMKNKWTENNLRAWRVHAKWEQIRWFGQGKRVPINSHSLNGLITMFPPIVRCTKCSLRDAPAHAMGIFAVSVSSLMMLMLMHSMHCHVNEKSQLCRSCQMLVTGTTTLNTIYFVKTNWIKLHHALVWHAFHEP